MRLGTDDIAIFRPGAGFSEADLPFHIVKPGGSIQNAVTAAADGRAIWIWPGTYNIAATIAVPHAVRIMGTGRDTIIFAQAPMNNLPIFQVANAVTEFWIADLRLDGAAATWPDFVDFAGTSGTNIFDNIETHVRVGEFISQTGGGGATSLLVDHCNTYGGVDCRESNVDLRDSVFRRVGAFPGFVFTSVGEHDFRIARCQFDLAGAIITVATAIPPAGSGHFACVDSQFSGADPGFAIQDGEVTFDGCNFTDNAAAGAGFNVTGGILSIVNSHLERIYTTGAAVSIIRVSNCMIDDTLLEWAGGGGQWIITGNVFDSAGQQAIRLLSGDRHTVMGNTILASNNPAIDIQADDTTVVGNALVAGGTINDGGANNVMGLNRIGA